MNHPIEIRLMPDPRADGAHALDDIRDIHTHSDDIEHQRGAIKQDVGLGRAEELDEEAEESDKGHYVEETGDEGGRLVDEAEVGLELVEVGVWDGVGGPEEREVVREGREEDAEEEADGCGLLAFDGWTRG